MAPTDANEDRQADAELVRRAQTGDARAFETLVRVHQGAIYGLIVRMVGERTVSEELTQDTFVQAWRNLAGFRGEARVSTWLYRIAVNLCRDHRGSRVARERRQETSLDGVDRGALPFVTRESAPDERIEEEEAARAYECALEELDPDHRAAFLLRHQEGLGPAEIAEVLGISASNAKVRIHRARQMILDTLRRLGHVGKIR